MRLESQWLRRTGSFPNDVISDENMQIERGNKIVFTCTSRKLWFMSNSTLSNLNSATRRSTRIFSIQVKMRLLPRQNIVAFRFVFGKHALWILTTIPIILTSISERFLSPSRQILKTGSDYIVWQFTIYWCNCIKFSFRPKPPAAKKPEDLKNTRHHSLLARRESLLIEAGNPATQVITGLDGVSS